MKSVYFVKNLLTRDHPLHAQWFITRKCNYRCKSCNVWKTQDSKELTTEEILYGLNELKKLGVVDLNITGGNPLLREDIDKIIEYASRHFITTIYDNGSMAYKKIDAVKHADYVAISLDTLDEKKQDYLSDVKCSFRQKIGSIKELLKNKIPVAISSTVSSLTEYDTVRMIERYGKFFSFNISLFQEDPEEAQFSIGENVKELETKDKKRMAETFERLVELKKAGYNILLPEKLLKVVKNYFEKNERSWKCKAFTKFLTIDHLGNVSGCHLKRPVTTIDKLRDFWYSEKAGQIRLENRRCKGCMYLCYIDYSLPLKTSVETVWTGVKSVLRELYGTL